MDKATNIVMNYTETESKVREATNDDPWGPSGTIVRYPVPASLIVWKYRYRISSLSRYRYRVCGIRPESGYDLPDFWLGSFCTARKFIDQRFLGNCMKM